MRDSLLRLIDDLVTKLTNSTQDVDHEDFCWVRDERWGLQQAYQYTILELRKVLDDHAKPNDLQAPSNAE